MVQAANGHTTGNGCLTLEKHVFRNMEKRKEKPWKPYLLPATISPCSG